MDDACDPSLEKLCFSVPWFIQPDKAWIDQYVAAFRKVIENHMQLLEADGKGDTGGRWYGTGNE